MVEGKLRATENDHHARAWACWTSAALSRAKTMPPLRDLLGPKRDREQAASDAQRLERMEAIARSWASLTAAPDTKGGSDVVS